MNDGTQHTEDPGEFYRAAHAAAEINGACCLEFFTCPHCQHKQTTVHCFRDVVSCGSCGKAILSRSPRPIQPGEVTADMLTAAITAAKRVTPRVDPATLNWIEQQEGAVKAMAVTYACHEIHRVLDAITDAARTMSGGHRV